MVGLNPAKFYGRLLPRPRIYCDVKFSDARVDPPESVNAALLEWAGDAHWNMGGTSNKRKRMQGKIEGRMSKLRTMEESDEEPSPKKSTKGQQTLSSRKSKPSHVTDSPKVMTPIEKMLASPPPKGRKSSPNRRNSGEFFVEKSRGQPDAGVKTKPRRKSSRKEPVIEDSDNDSDDGLDTFMENLEANKDDPNRNMRRSARLPATPKVLVIPEAKKSTSLKGSPRSDGEHPVTPNSFRTPVSRKCGDDDSESESDTDSHVSYSQFY